MDYFVRKKKKIIILFNPHRPIAISRQISPLTYPEHFWLFLKRSNEAICKGFGSKNFMPDWRLPESPGGQTSAKTSKFVKITWLFTVIKPSSQKILGGKSLSISQGCRFKKKIWNQSQTNFDLKKAYYWVTLIQTAVSKRLDFKKI